MSGITNQPCRLLIVDDNRNSARALATLLGTFGYQVEIAFDGVTALEVAEIFDPDACILDINMPGMNGYELARRLRETATSRPIVLATVTACSDDDHLDRAVRAGFDLHFTKPVDPAEVAEQLEKASQEIVFAASRLESCRHGKAALSR